MKSNADIKILTIDDEPVLRQTIVAYLEDCDYQLLEAGNGKEGLAVFEAERPDLILCDLRMPVMDGLEVLAELRKLDADVPIVMVSGAGVMSDVVDALRLGAWDYLIKPIRDLAVLEHTVSRCLERTFLLRQNQKYKENLEQSNRRLQESLSALEEDQRAGREVQRRLLPANELAFEQHAFSYIFVPSLYLSGDFLDYFTLEAGVTAFLIADVSGHGASSAFVTMLLKSQLSLLQRQYRSKENNHLARPEQVLDYLNQELLASKLGKYVTMFYAVLDNASHKLCYAIAGHYPSPILYSTEDVAFLPGQGFPVGVFDKAVYTSHEITLPAQYSLMMCSDGVMEIAPGESLKEKERFLLDMVTRNPSLDHFSETLALESIDGAPDDITILLLHGDKPG